MRWSARSPSPAWTRAAPKPEPLMHIEVRGTGPDLVLLHGWAMHGGVFAALAASASVQARGFLVGAIRPPSVPEGQARLRVTLNVEHTDAQVDARVQALCDACLPLETAGG